MFSRVLRYPEPQCSAYPSQNKTTQSDWQPWPLPRFPPGKTQVRQPLIELKMKTNSLEKPEPTLLRIWNVLSGSPLGQRLRTGHCWLSQRWPFNLGWHTEWLKSISPNILPKSSARSIQCFQLGKSVYFPTYSPFRAKGSHSLISYPSMTWPTLGFQLSSGCGYWVWPPREDLPYLCLYPHYLLPWTPEELTLYPAARYHGWGSILMTLIVSLQIHQAWCGCVW